MAAGLILTTAFAAEVTTNTNNSTKAAKQFLQGQDGRGFGGIMIKQNPLTMLENRKDNLQSLVTEGKITQAQANIEISKIDAKITETKAFEALTLAEKRVKLTSDMETRLALEVKEGRITQTEADTQLAEFKTNIATWTGDDEDALARLTTQKTSVEARLAEGKITQTQANVQIATIDAKVKEVKAFNALTLAEKKAKLTADMKTKLAADVTAGRITQEKSDLMMKNFTTSLENYDGTYYPLPLNDRLGDGQREKDIHGRR